MTVAAHIVGGTGDTSYLGSNSDRLAIVQDSPNEAAQRQLGTKWFLVSCFELLGDRSIFARRKQITFTKHQPTEIY